MTELLLNNYNEGLELHGTCLITHVFRMSCHLIFVGITVIILAFTPTISGNIQECIRNHAKSTQEHGFRCNNGIGPSNDSLPI